MPSCRSTSLQPQERGPHPRVAGEPIAPGGRPAGDVLAAAIGQQMQRYDLVGLRLGAAHGHVEGRSELGSFDGLHGPVMLGVIFKAHNSGNREGRWYVSEAAAIEVRGLVKRFGEVRALDGVDLVAQQGKVLGLLGPNGAGKTTLVRVLATLIEPDAGSASVLGFDVHDDAAALRERIGLAGQYAAVDENLTGLENLTMVGRLYGERRSSAKARGRELLARFDLVEAAGRATKTYSGGMRRRLDLAAALVARPPVIFLDEPTTGLDPRSRLSLWAVIEDLVAEGTTVLLTTQYLDEADRLADTIAVIDHGRLIAEGTPDQLKDRLGGERLEVHLDGDSDPQQAVQALSSMADGHPIAEDGLLRLSVRERNGAIMEAVRRLSEAGIGVDDLALRRPTLDEVFLALTGRAAEDPDQTEEQEDAA
jgi:ABC-2 type transport system ATP-binding protein